MSRYLSLATRYSPLATKMQFTKYQGTGNDFVIIDDRNAKFPINDTALIAQMCDRKFGIGADGLILLHNHADYDFQMIYFNADGRESSMCGNGGRCIVAFAYQLQLIDNQTTFLAIDGKHEARIVGKTVELKMCDVSQTNSGEGFYTLDTGSPHYIKFVDSVAEVDVFTEGKTIRNSPPFKAEGINVNFVENTANGIRVATYERGVEDETLSCGTGVTAAALAYYLQNGYSAGHAIPVETKGGNLEVRFQPSDEGFSEIWLCGAAERVFEGRWTDASLDD